MPKEFATARDFGKIITNLSEHQEELGKIHELSSRYEEELSDLLDVYVRDAGRKWNKISDTISRLSKEDLAKLKVLRPHTDYLSKYKLLTLTDKMPKPGDAFIDLVTHYGSNFVWSPRDPEKFRAWRKNATEDRSYVCADSGRLLLSGKIEDVKRLDPNVYIVAIVSAIR